MNEDNWPVEEGISDSKNIISE